MLAYPLLLSFVGIDVDGIDVDGYINKNVASISEISLLHCVCVCAHSQRRKIIRVTTGKDEKLREI